MIVWQSCVEGSVERARGSQGCHGNGRENRSAHHTWQSCFTSKSGGWQMSRGTRLALEYTLAIGCALASSWLILRLGL